MPSLTLWRMNRMKLKDLPSTSAGGRCNVCVPIQYENKWAVIKRFTALQRTVKLFSRNLGKRNDALNARLKVLTETPCSRYSKIECSRAPLIAFNWLTGPGNAPFFFDLRILSR